MFIDRGRRTTRKCYSLYSVVEILTTCDGSTAIDANIGRKSRVLPHLGGPHRNTATTFGMEKLDWCGYLVVKKNMKMYLFVSTEYAQWLK